MPSIVMPNVLQVGKEKSQGSGIQAWVWGLQEFGEGSEEASSEEMCKI